MNNVWLIASGKGGTGKSSLAVNLGAISAAAGRRVALVDLAIGLRCLDLYLGLADRVLFDVMDVMEGNCLPGEALLKHPEISGLSLLPAAQNRREDELAGDRIRELCKFLSSEHDMVLLDCPPGLGRIVGQAAVAADRAILVATPEPAALRDADRVAAELMAAGVTETYLVINRFLPENVHKLAQPKAPDMAEIVGLPLLGTIPEDFAVTAAILQGTAVCRLQPESPASLAYQTIARRIPGKDNEDA